MSVVYKITNLVNGAVCVGQSQLPIQERWNELVEYSKDQDTAKSKLPCLRILTMIRRYGEENFTIESLFEGLLSPEKLNTQELEEIKKLNDIGITVYHRTGTFLPNDEVVDKFCSVDEDSSYFYG
jgi:hypothetical protein